MLDILLGSKATWRVLILLSETPGGRLSRPEIKRLTKLGNNALTVSLKTLIAFDIIDVKKKGIDTYGFNLGNELTRKAIEICELERKKLNNLPYGYSLILREYVRKVLAIVVPNQIILFGSVAKRVYSDSSDIDVALVIDKEMPVKVRLEIEEAAEELKKRFGKEIQQHIFTIKEFEKKDKLIQEIKRDGVDLL